MHGDARVGVELVAGRASIAIGRPAQPGEQYASSTNAFFPGEVLHCSGIFMKTVEQAEPVLEGLDEQVLWRSLERSIDDVNGIDPALIAGQYVVDATPVSDEVLMIRVSPTPDLDPVARDAISELEQQGC